MRRLLPYVVALGAAALASAERALPDLVVEDLVVAPPAVRARVVNRGSASAAGCNIELRLFDHQTHRATGLSRRGNVPPVPAGGVAEVSFPYEPAFAGQHVRLTVDSGNRITETDERNNVSAVVRAALPKRPPTRVPG